MQIRLNTTSQKAAYITTVNTFHPRYVRLIPKNKSKDPTYYIQQPAFLDTETSNNHNDEDPIGWVINGAWNLMGNIV